VQSVKKPTWQQATALMSLSTCGAMTGFTFAHGTVAELTSPASMPAHLTALDTPATPASSNDSALRSAIVSVVKYYLQMAQSKTPAAMEALIWQADSTDGADHGQSCAAFASLTLALGAQAVGQQSWVSGGGSYPWPLHRWADVRVQPNPASPNVVSMLQDAQAHHRWHPPAAVQAVAPLEPQVAGQQAVAPLAAVPGVLAPGASADGATGVPGGVSIPGVAGALAVGAVGTRALGAEPRPGPRIAPRGSRMSTRRYVPQIPQAVTADFVAVAKGPLTRAQPLYQDVASRTGISWELLAACDWMQCQARPRYSPVYGEKLGTANPDGMVFQTKSAALIQCASDLVELADAVYVIDLTVRRALSVWELANTFAAFRWGGLLQVHAISAMEFPYSVAGLTSQHLKMRWPEINHPRAPDKPGTRFRMPFGAVPAVLSLGYLAVA
jgi:hypothetical protein